MSPKKIEIQSSYAGEPYIRCELLKIDAQAYLLGLGYNFSTLPTVQ